MSSYCKQYMYRDTLLFLSCLGAANALMPRCWNVRLCRRLQAHVTANRRWQRKHTSSSTICTLRPSIRALCSTPSAEIKVCYRTGRKPLCAVTHCCWHSLPPAVDVADSTRNVGLTYPRTPTETLFLSQITVRTEGSWNAMFPLQRRMPPSLSTAWQVTFIVSFARCSECAGAAMATLLFSDDYSRRRALLKATSSGLPEPHSTPTCLVPTAHTDRSFPPFFIIPCELGIGEFI